MAEIVIDPEVPEAVRRELEQYSLSALVGFSDPLPGQDPLGDEDDAGPVFARPEARFAAGAIVAVMAVIFGVGLSSPGPFSADLVFLALLIGLPCTVTGGLHLLRKAIGSGAGTGGRQAVGEAGHGGRLPRPVRRPRARPAGGRAGPLAAREPGGQAIRASEAVASG